MEVAYDLLKALALLGEVTLDNPKPLPPLNHAAHNVIVLGTTFDKFLDGIDNTAHSPTLTLQQICETPRIIDIMHLRYRPFQYDWYLHFARVV